MTALLEVRAHASWTRFSVLGLWSRRLTEPPRPANAGLQPSCKMSGPKGWRRSRHKLLFRACRARPKDGARLAALRPPFGNLCPPSSCNCSISNVSRSRRLCQPPRPQPSLSEIAPNSQAEPSQKKQSPRTPAALREQGSGEEGKDSHSRQWRLSMAVFLNRNKRPQAAPIEVAELLSEKPPLPPESPHRNLFGKEREGGDFSEEKSPPSHKILFTCFPQSLPQLPLRP